MLKFRLRIPLWAVLAVAGTAYLARAYVLRRGDMSPDMPGDLIAFSALLFVVLVAWYLRVQQARDVRRGDAQGEDDDERDRPALSGQDDEVQRL